MTHRFNSFLGLAMVAIGSLTLLPSQNSLMAQELPKASADPIGYFLGLDIGGSLAQQGFKEGDFDPAVMAAGIADAIAGRDSQLPQEQLQEVQGKLRAIMQKRAEEQQAVMEKQAAMNKEKGALWLEKNAKEKGIKVLKDGVQMKTLTAGKGGSPTVSDRVTVHYTGKTIDGKTFDSSVARGEPATFMLGQVIKGWQSALQEMKVGEKAMVYIPSDLAYGPRGSAPSIGPNEVLIFEVELIEIP